MLRHKFGTYWNQTETYEALKIYIQMDMDGLKDSVVRMLAGESVPINIGTFSNDMTTFATKDDVLTLLVHLGYLTYDSVDGTVSIPNKEVSKEYVNAISTMNWHGVAESVESSRKLLEALWKQDADAVATGIEKAHEEISIPVSYTHLRGTRHRAIRWIRQMSRRRRSLTVRNSRMVYIITRMRNPYSRSGFLLRLQICQHL